MTGKAEEHTVCKTCGGPLLLPELEVGECTDCLEEREWERNQECETGAMRCPPRE